MIRSLRASVGRGWEVDDRDKGTSDNVGVRDVGVSRGRLRGDRSSLLERASYDVRRFAYNDGVVRAEEP